jgi:hypothetical protein
MKKVFIILVAVVLGACSNQPSSEKYREAANDLAMASFDMQAPPPPGQPVAVERKLIKNGDLSFETSDVDKTKTTIEQICSELNAYIANESQHNFDERLQYNQTIRVPAQKFDALIQHLEKLALKIDSKQINTQDVTEEFIDVEARLTTKKELEARYREILKQAKTVADMVSIESQIAAVRAEIESMEGRLNYLKNQVAFSTLHVSYYKTLGIDFGFMGKLVQAMSQGWNNLLTFLIVLVNLWPFLLILAIGTWIITRWRNRKKANPQ